MRAKVAFAAGGHPFESRFVNMSELQLALSYGFLRDETRRDREREVNTIKQVLKRVEQLFEVSNLFTNPKAYQFVQEQKALEGQREEVPVEDFDNIWKEIMDSGVPEVMVMEEITSDENPLPAFDKDLQDLVAGFVSFKDRKDGD